MNFVHGRGRWWLPVVVATVLSSHSTSHGQDGPTLTDLLKQVAGQAAERSQEQIPGLSDEPDDQEPVPGEEPEITVTPDGRVEMHVADLPLATVLQLLSLEGRRNIIASPSVSGTVTASLYNVTFEEALNAVLVANGASYRREGHFIYVYTNEELARMELAANPPESRVFALSYLSPVDAQSYITPLLSENGVIAIPPTAATGIASSEDSAGGYSAAGHDFIIVTDLPAVLDRVERLLDELDVRPLQVLIEATIVRADLSEENALGIDFSVVGGVDLELLGATSNGIQDLTLGALPVDRFELFNANASTDFRSNVPSGGLSIGIIKDHVGMFLRALEQVTDTTVIANPKVLALNKQKGQVIVGRRDGYLTTTVTETQAVQTVEFLETGTQLLFRPYIGRDGFVRVELHPEDSVGFVNAQGLPSEQTTEVTTNVIVQDGHTILIGGLFRDVSTDAQSQIPGLGNLPGVGALFRSNNDSMEREEVIILLTIHIVKDHYAYADASIKAAEDIERLRVGMRRGMMWTGRERLGQMHYQRAVKLHADGRDDKALWHLKMALHNNPRMLPAIDLREQIEGQRRWNHEGAASRDFIYRMINDVQGEAVPNFRRPEVEAPAMTEEESDEPAEE